jgi:outer membrane protein OmpA-like peptidoglycan-associated protein
MTLKGYSIAVYGYTDDIGTQTYNLQFSQRRAEAVRDFLGYRQHPCKNLL